MSEKHPTLAKLLTLATGRAPTTNSIALQQHLFNCPSCLAKLLQLEAVNEITVQSNPYTPLPDCRKPLFVVHDTADGPVYSRAEKRGRKWVARHWGEELSGMRLCRTIREANKYLEQSFGEMFPEHRCTKCCKNLDDNEGADAAWFHRSISDTLAQTREEHE
jgi:hypothetical protein